VGRDVYLLEKYYVPSLHSGDAPLVLLVNKCGNCMVLVVSPALTVEPPQGATIQLRKKEKGGSAVSARQRQRRYALEFILTSCDGWKGLLWPRHKLVSQDTRKMGRVVLMIADIERKVSEL
jgi:hypothetical protein